MYVKRQAAPVREQAAKNIREAIISGFYSPGQRLYEKELCELTGVSRTSIREALRQLEAEGIIKMLPSRGPCVAKLTLDEVRENYEVRMILESHAFRMFAERATEGQIREIDELLKNLERGYAARNSGDIVRLKDQFYERILDGCGNSLIRSFLKSINARTAFLRKITLSSNARMDESIREVKKIVRHLKKRDGEGAFLASIEHTTKAQEAALSSLEGSLGARPADNSCGSPIRRG